MHHIIFAGILDYESEKKLGAQKMGLKKSLKDRLTRVSYGIETPYEFLLFLIDYILWRFVRKTEFFYPVLVQKSVARRREREFGRTDHYRIKDAKLPLLDDKTRKIFWEGTFYTSFYPYCFLDDCYDEDMIRPHEALLNVDFYGLKNERVDVRIMPGDIVVDAGSWVGDFAAYASAKGAVVYAFEPDKGNFNYLRKTSELNANIYPFREGLGDSLGELEMAEDSNSSMGSNFLNAGEGHKEKVRVSTIDALVKERNLERIDFIKASVQGFEVKLLQGAKETLRRFSPKIACFYNYYYYADVPDMDQELEAILKEANPAYRVVRKRRKLFASVPQK